jgi:nucleoside-diphosphate-sugar epimerase
MALLNKVGILNRGYTEWVDKPLKYTLWMDSSKARKQLGWKPKYDSAGAIKAFLESGRRKS